MALARIFSASTRFGNGGPLNTARPMEIRHKPHGSPDWRLLTRRAGQSKTRLSG
jgi:hypothetical protein